jgi:hypothetical protein
MPPILTGFKMVFGAASEPTYTITPSTTSVNEGSSVIFTINTYNVPDGTLLYWTTNTVSGTVNTSDFSDSSISGSFVINGGVATVTRTLTNDITTEGTESFQLQIRTGSTGGPIVATSATVTINDTSIAVFATGGTKTTNGSFTIHTFTSPGTFTIASGSKNCHVLVVAGGGGGGGGNGGTAGGGAGGAIYIPSSSPQSTMSTGNYSISIGGGGSVFGAGSDTTLTDTSGTPFGSLTAAGGGSSPGGNGQNGGSGGGTDGDGGPTGSGVQPFQPGKSGSFGYGQPGGGQSNSSFGWRAGGGGGATQAGNPGSTPGSNTTSSGKGGDGIGPPIFGPWMPTSLGVNGYFAGGGGGGSRGDNGQNIGGAGGLGGGGQGLQPGSPSPGVANTGGGGGGWTEPGSSGGSGGSGIVVIGYLT